MIFGLDPPGARMFACRSIQLVLGLLVIITSAWLSLRLIGSVLYGVAGGCMGVVVLIGAVGMFAFKRPRDVHWHLTLMLDWLALILILYCTVTYTLYAAYISYELNIRHQAMVVVSCVSSWILMLVTIFSIARTYRLKKQGKLPPPGKFAQDWVHMDEQDAVKP